MVPRCLHYLSQVSSYSWQSFLIKSTPGARRFPTGTITRYVLDLKGTVTHRFKESNNADNLIANSSDHVPECSIRISVYE